MTTALAPALAALLLASGTVTSHAVQAGTADGADAGTCALGVAGSEAAKVATCLACHAGSGSGHPVGLVYAPSAHRAGSGLRSPAEVIAAGVLLPEGELRCTTCHDGRSQVRFRLALPAVTLASLAPGTRVSAKPLCLACHAL